MGKGKDVTRDQVVAIKAAYDKVREDVGPGRPVGPTKVTQLLPGSLKRTSVA